MKDIKMSKYLAYVKLPMHILILNKVKGFKVSSLAYKEFKKSRFDPDIYSVFYQNEIVWVSIEEFKERQLVEFEVKGETD